MSLFDKIKATASKVSKAVTDQYISFNADKELLIKQKALELLCSKTVEKVEQIADFALSDECGFLATIRHNNMDIKLHFTPEAITKKKGMVEGQLRLLKKPDIKTDSVIYNVLIAGWKVCLGGDIPKSKLPENVSINGNLVTYTFSLNEVKIIQCLFSKIEEYSKLVTRVDNKTLYIKGDISFESINLSDLACILGLQKAE